MNEHKTALEITRLVHKTAGACQTFLFGSRARGDHRLDSDVDVAIIMQPAPTEEHLEAVRSEARRLQREQLPEASGIDVLCIVLEEFRRGARLRNNMANTIVKEGKAIMPGEGTEYRYDHGDEETDWQDVEDRLQDAVNGAADLDLFLETGQVERVSDKSSGRIAQTALDNAYKSLLGAHGFTYPTTGRDGHNLRVLVEKIRKDLEWPEDEEVPGEQHQYLTVFGQADAQEHPPLDKERIAREVPEAVRTVQAMVDELMEH